MEETLVRRLQAGDEGAFDELFALYQKQAVRTATLITGDASLAEDVTQEAFVLCLFLIEGNQFIKGAFVPCLHPSDQ